MLESGGGEKGMRCVLQKSTRDGTERTFATDALPQARRVLDLRGVRLIKVDVHVEAAAHAVVDGSGESFVGRAERRCRWVDVRLAVGIAFAGVWSAAGQKCVESVEGVYRGGRERGQGGGKKWRLLLEIKRVESAVSFSKQIHLITA